MPMTDALPETANTWTELWLAQCERDPAAPALLSAVPGQMGLWSRRELEQRIEAWARRLRECGIGAGDSVAVLLPRGPALVSAWLSLQRLGAAFVPLDPAYPAARQQLILNDAAVVALLSDAEQAELLPPGVACIDVSAWGEGLPAGESAAAVLTHPEQLAYRLYTSGSTGRPKGVLVGQRGLATLVRAQAEAFDLGPGDRVLQFASPGFDAAVAETLVSLGAGATLVLAPQAELMPGEALARTAQHLAITAMTLPPSALAVMPADSLATVRSLVLAGEACPAQLVARWSIGRRMVNAYGPTEATVCASVSAPLSGALTPPIGYLLPGFEALLLDAEGQVLPGAESGVSGASGELCLGGPALAWGYAGLPGLTAERFVPHPSGRGGERLYRTGDRVRRRDDGQFEFLGRVDEQIKLRGFRIEPGEIEALLGAEAGVAAVKVCLRQLNETQQALVAYVHAHDGASLDRQALRRALQARLPAHMVPSHLVLLDPWPANSHGKLDTQALPLPCAADSWAGQEAADDSLPRDERENALAAVFAEVLGLAEVPCNASFFDLGGHSLSATRLLSRLRARWPSSADLDLEQLFDAPSVRELALLLAGASR
ncbi:non-ribosomal peptide synthetase [Paucibacter sp. B51]|uniref:non-ribosomal peptide synthetase n=1 Tax=Paucibacter sp. B51 TaxID=2993315 RepID=UPI0022EBCDB5|nr:non-ribosomal peptide synthetase [Paucibacter sp. B51]